MMAKKMTAEERFEKFKEKLSAQAMGDFFAKYLEMRDIEDALIKEKKEQNA